MVLYNGFRHLGDELSELGEPFINYNNSIVSAT